MTSKGQQHQDKNGNGGSAQLAAAVNKQGARIQDILEARKGEIAKALPKHLTADRLVRVALTAIGKIPKLAECTGSSLWAALMACAELGLEPGGALGHAYLIPFENRKAGVTECQLIVGYRGLLELIRRSGELAQIEAHVIHEKDEYSVEYGLNPKFVHKPKLDGDPGKPVLTYVIARLRDGSSHVEIMTTLEVEKIRSRSKSKDSGPWVTDWEEMAKKTVVRRAFKYLPVSSERLVQALEVDNEDYVDGEVTGRDQLQELEPGTRTQTLKGKLQAARSTVAPIVDMKAGQTEEQALAAHLANEPPEEPGSEG
jgi:recombination protein RecT